MIDSESIYWPETLPAPSVSYRRRSEPRSNAMTMETKRTRVYRSHTAPIKVLEVKFNFTEDEYSLFQSFFITDLQQGSLSFVLESMELGVSVDLPRTYVRELAFLDPSYHFTRTDNLVIVDASFEVVSENFNVFIPFYVRPEIGVDDVPFEDSASQPLEVIYE